MKKLLILITAIVCLGFFLVFAGGPIVPVTGFLKGAGILAAIGVLMLFGMFILFGMFYAGIILCIGLPMVGGIFLSWFVGAVFNWRSEFFCHLGFVLTACFLSAPLWGYFYRLIETLG